MTKMNEKTKGKWKARILAGALALSIAFPAGIMSQAHVAKAASITEEQTVSELSKLADVGIDTAFVTFEEYVPGGKVISPMLKYILGELNGGDREMSLEDINANINGLYEKINDLEKNISEDMKAIGNTGLFDYTMLTPLNSSIKSLTRHMNGYRNGDYTNAQALAKIGGMVGNGSDWSKTSHPFMTFTSVVSKMNEADPLTKKSLFKTIYDYYASKSMLSGEAYDQSKVVVDRIMKNVMTSYTVLMECLMAQLEYNALPDMTGVDPVDHNNICNDNATIIREMNFLTEQVFGNVKDDSLNDANTLMQKYQETFPEDFNRLIIIDKGKGAYVLRNLPNAAVMRHELQRPTDENNARDNFNNWKDGMKGMSSEMAKDLAAYAKAKGMTIREFLTSYGYDMSPVPKNANLVTSKAWADKYDVKRAFSALAGFAWYHAYYRGINVDAKVSGDSEVKFWTRGHNNWTDGYESHYEQGTAVII
ncbi:MAG: hypothetical protein IJI65_10350 [Lachnospiraceae bacterium]|nr:hypothetical protein [Lachnospiraceae bacterium]